MLGMTTDLCLRIRPIKSRFNAIVQQGIMDYLRISFMISGHTNFSLGQLFSITARDFYSSDVRGT